MCGGTLKEEKPTVAAEIDCSEATCEKCGARWEIEANLADMSRVKLTQLFEDE